MKIAIAIIAVCASTLAVVHANMALANVAGAYDSNRPMKTTNAGIRLAASEPIPGVDIIVRKNPGGTMIKVGDCQSGGGKVVKKAGQWVCTGLPATGKALPKTGQ